MDRQIFDATTRTNMAQLAGNMQSQSEINLDQDEVACGHLQLHGLGDVITGHGAGQ
jgi:hypothetical protein